MRSGALKKGAPGRNQRVQTIGDRSVCRCFTTTAGGAVAGNDILSESAAEAHRRAALLETKLSRQTVSDGSMMGVEWIE